MHNILKSELEKIKLEFENKILNIKNVFLKDNNDNFLEKYRLEKELLKEYNCKTSNEIIDILVELEFSLEELSIILHYK